MCVSQSQGGAVGGGAGLGVGGCCALILSDWLSRSFGGVSGIEQEMQGEMTSSLQEHME